MKEVSCRQEQVIIIDSIEICISVFMLHDHLSINLQENLMMKPFKDTTRRRKNKHICL